MPIDGKLLEILCCPVSKTPLTRLSSARLEKLNTAILEGEVQTVNREAVTQVLNEALITEDSKVMYPVIDDSEALDLSGARQMHEKLSKETFPEARVGLLHGRHLALRLRRRTVRGRA